MQHGQECWGRLSHALLVWSLAATAVATSAIIFKEYAVRHNVRLPLLMSSQVVLQSQRAHPVSSATNTPTNTTPDTPQLKTISAAPTFIQLPPSLDPEFVGPPEPDTFIADLQLRWFHGRPIRPAQVLWMTVTAYSPDDRSCGIYADGRTATMHCVTTNARLLVAADPTILPYGSMLTIPGYAAPPDTEKVADVDITANWANQRALEPGAEGVVPVLDCGGAIKGFRLDLLFPTHQAAREWGTKLLPVTVWEYTDGMPKPNPRRLR